jgi:Xaa-Pro aminopeptidase
MSKVRAILALGFFLCLRAGAAPIAKAEYRARREEFRKSLDGTLVLFGYTEGRDQVFQVPQNHDFLYLTGWTQPGAVVLITRERETLFLPHRNTRAETYMGRRTDASDADAREVTGFDQVAPIEKFEPALLEAIGTSEKVYSETESPDAPKLEKMLAFRHISPAAPMIAKLRMKKSPAEIAAIRKTTNISVEAQRAAWKRLAGGVYEYQAAATFTGSLLEAGCEGNAYSPIFGSGPNSTVLHYSANTRRMDSGEVIVIDAGAQCDFYTTDITRTLPVGGRFTPRQKQLYGYVLGAQNAVLAAIKPGVEISSLTKIAKDFLDQYKDGDGTPMSKYLPHGVSHHVGLDVHDATAPGALEAGMVITVEPGIYIPKENIGIRIEDTVLVTGKGVELLSGSLPREPEEVEKALAH